MSTYRLLDILNLTKDFFTKNNIENSRFEAEQILSSYFKIKRLDLYLQFEKPVNESELAEIRELLKRRKNGEPLQYILGETGFLGNNYKVNKNVLIPRFDTEVLAAELIDILKKSDKLYRILDIGTGSGCIPISVLCECQNCEFIAIDISDDALETAKENGKINGVSERVSFFKRDILEEFRVKEKFDIVVSNPPYIPLHEYENLDSEVKNYEPRGALTDGGDGLKFYRRFAELLPLILKGDGLFLFEIGYNQKDDISKIFENYEIDFIKDISGHTRVVKGKMRCIG
ncbi:MAG: peptide chain release factor N(5)-glutamine methyltransferase [Candidatus Delongbacteria bacterium]|nr:peptide chain release factor N(5)-glutamine methyltransferase [Candidatus Delongbacteria bacterium]MBN2836364.1 peptide chain release factor N(5)-glutamine methyltransferase [Candidatus Delongbacteria bacterium]